MLEMYEAALSASTLELSARPRSYAEAMEAWQSHCPQLTIWEDALHAGRIRVERARVALTQLGEATLDGRKRQPTAVV